MKMRILLVGLCLLVCACGTKTTTPDMAVVQDMSANMPVCCGMPGDTGNDLGVGKYCTDSTQCTGNTICSAPVKGPRYPFCTTPCVPPDMGGSPTACGTDAVCQCQPMLGCGCVPAKCLVNPPAGCL